MSDLDQLLQQLRDSHRATARYGIYRHRLAEDGYHGVQEPTEHRGLTFDEANGIRSRLNAEAKSSAGNPVFNWGVTSYGLKLETTLPMRMHAYRTPRMNMTRATTLEPNTVSKPTAKRVAPKLVMGEILGHIDLPAHVTTGAAKLADEFYTSQEEHEWSGDQVETYAEPLWLKRGGTTWRPSVSHLDLEPTGRQSELVVTAGVDQHVDDFHGPVLLVVIHNDGLKFKQGKVSHAPVAGDWFIFNDRMNHGVSSKPGRATFVGWAIPLQPAGSSVN